MKRLTSIISILLLSFFGFGLFHVAQNVRDYENDLKKLNREIKKEKETIHTLKAEWQYLNQPDRLENLVHKHTELKAISEKNLLSLSVLPVLEEKMLSENEQSNERAQKDNILQEKLLSARESYVSKTAKGVQQKDFFEELLQPQTISLRDIWGQR